MANDNVTEAAAAIDLAAFQAQFAPVLEAWLERRDLAHHRTDDGVYTLSFGGADEVGNVHIAIGAGGDCGIGVAVFCRADQVVTRPAFSGALWGVNAWNGASRVVKARLVVQDWADGHDGHVELEAYLPLLGMTNAVDDTAGIETYLDIAVAGSLGFWGMTPSGE